MAPERTTEGEIQKAGPAGVIGSFRSSAPPLLNKAMQQKELRNKLNQPSNSRFVG